MENKPALLGDLISGMQNLLIECEVTSDKAMRLINKYEKTSGRQVDSRFIKIQNNKWGAEYRMYFDASKSVVDGFRNLGYHIEERVSGYGSDRAYRINSEELFWELIKRGYRLGPN